MVEHGSEFYHLTKLDNLFACWIKASRNKGGRERILRFAEDPLRLLSTIQERLRNRTYTFGPYRSFTVREKKFRDVIDAPIKDRVVHWMLYEYLLPIWQPRFIHDTYGNLPGRGTHAAVQRLSRFCRKHDARWALQLDLSKYFYSVNHELLEQRALRYIGDSNIRALIIGLIDSFRTDDRYDALFAPDSMYRMTENKGMPIGNLSSQLFANIFLSDFDHWVKESLRVKHYIRYVDDFVLLHESAQWLNEALDEINAYLPSLGLTLNPSKTIIQPIARGVDFVGQVIKPWRRTTRKRTLNEALRRTSTEPAEKLFETANSYFGMLRQATHSHRERARLANIVRKRGYCINKQLTQTYRRSE